jgi:hypothetical protein
MKKFKVLILDLVGKLMDHSLLSIFKLIREENAIQEIICLEFLELHHLVILQLMG